MANEPSPAPVHVDARGMKCPWPALRAARAMRDASEVLVFADDPAAARELTALAQQHGWGITLDTDRYLLTRAA